MQKEKGGHTFARVRVIEHDIGKKKCQEKKRLDKRAAEEPEQRKGSTGMPGVPTHPRRQKKDEGIANAGKCKAGRKVFFTPRGAGGVKKDPQRKGRGK